MILNDTPALLAALKLAKAGDTLLLAPGSYASIMLKNVILPGVTIASADPANPAIIAGVELTGCEGLTVRGLEVTISARTKTAFNVVGCKDVHLIGLDVHGEAGGELAGLMFRTSSNVSATECDFHDLGTTLRNIDSTGVTISACRFHDVRGDGIQTSGTSDITLEDNYFTNFYTKVPAHPDAIQFFTVNTKAPAKGIRIRRNKFERGVGDIIQGIFLGNEIDMPYIDVDISENVILGSMYNGIAIDGGQNVRIVDNLVQAFPDMGSWIMTTDCTNATVQGNWSTSYVKKGALPGFVDKDNVTIAAAAAGKSLLAAWTSDKADDTAADLIAAARALAGALQVELDTTKGELQAVLSSAKATRAVLALVVADRDEDRAAMAEAQARLAAAMATFAPAA